MYEVTQQIFAHEMTSLIFTSIIVEATSCELTVAPIGRGATPFSAQRPKVSPLGRRGATRGTELDGEDLA
jgi:hypothetical protein